MIDLGDRAPALKGTTGTGESLRLTAAKGHWLVVYFYPKDNTPGCTIEAQSFRDLASEFSKHDAQIIGVSRDPAPSHQRFSTKQALNFPLIADTDETWCQAFDVIHEKVLYGKHHLGVVRSTFLLDPKQHVREIWRNVKVAGHAQAVLDALIALRAPV